MEYVTSTQSEQTYRVGPALPALGAGYFRGFTSSQEVTLRVVVDDPQAIALLQAEAALLTHFCHPQIATLRDQGGDEQHWFLVFDGPAATPLSDCLYQTHLSPVVALDIILQITDILAELHQADMAWGRFCPQAFWVSKTGRLKLINLREASQPINAQALTIAEATYFAPELGAEQIPTVQSDLYACGVFAYELLTGKAPFTGSNTAEIVMRHTSESLPDLVSTHPEVPTDVSELIIRCLDKAPEARPTSAAELHNVLAPMVERLRVEERAQMITCPRCDQYIRPAARCPLCHAPLQAQTAPQQSRRTIKWQYPAMGVGLFIIFCALTSLFNQGNVSSSSGAQGQPEPEAAQTVQATRSAGVSDAPLHSTPVPTGTAVPLTHGHLQSEAGNVANPHIDIIAASVIEDRGDIVVTVEVAGQIQAQPNETTYAVFFDTDDTYGDLSVPWREAGADYTVVYRSGDEVATFMEWDGIDWLSTTTVNATVDDGILQFKIPQDWLYLSDIFSYGMVSTHPQANLTDTVPPPNETMQLVRDLAHTNGE
ncbi:MAG: protein kinase [Chloroflexota bacterium]